VKRPLPRTAIGRGLALVALFAVTGVLLWWRGPDWGVVYHAFSYVQWRWIAAAIALNLVSVIVRALAWQTVIDQAVPPPGPRFRDVFSAFGIGLLGNAVLPGRMGELARVAVLRRRLPRNEGWTATLVGTVFAHRLFDLVPASLLFCYVLLTARIPHWAVTSLTLVGALGVALFAASVVGARRGERSLDGAGTIRRLLGMARIGLSVMKRPLPAIAAALLQCSGWFLQLLAVWVTMQAFQIDAPMPAAALVLLLMNVATIFPLWPGNVGLLQAAVALPLVEYGVAYGTGFAFALGLQAVEMSVGVGVGVAFLAHEGLSLGTLRRMPEPEDRNVMTVEAAEEEVAALPELDVEPRVRAPRARVPG
jgi:uncharacterized membrane protein YbhN (UPF0104 family)